MPFAQISINDGEYLDGTISWVKPSESTLGSWECAVTEAIDFDLLGETVTIRAIVDGETHTGTAIVTRMNDSVTEFRGTGPLNSVD